MPVDGEQYPLTALEQRSGGVGESPVALLHGWGGDLDTLSGLATPLTQQRRVIALSLPGFGGSPEPESSWGTWDYVALVRRWLEAEAPAGTDIIAHSFGGRIAVGLAARHPELVNRLVLIGSAGLKPPRRLKTRVKIAAAKAMNRMAGLLGGKAAEWLSERKRLLGSADWQAASPVMRGTLSRVLREDLSRECRLIKAPTLLIWGEDDRDTPPILGRRMARLIPNARLVVVPGAGHYCFLDKRGEVLAQVWRHLGLNQAW